MIESRVGNVSRSCVDAVARPVAGAIGKCLRSYFDAPHVRINRIAGRKYTGDRSRSRVRINRKLVCDFWCVAGRILADCGELWHGEVHCFFAGD